MKDNKIYVEYLGAYDGWLSWHNSGEDKEYHRVSNSLILETKQPTKYGPVYFKTESGYFRNLHPVTKKEYDNIGEGETSLIGE